MELLIVLAIISALLSTVTPYAVRTLAKAKATQVALNFRSLQVTLLEYYITETPGSTVDVNTLYAKRYISSKPENYITNWATFTSDVARAYVIYTNTDVDLNLVENSLQQVVYISTYTGKDGAYIPDTVNVSEGPVKGYYPALIVSVPRF